MTSDKRDARKTIEDLELDKHLAAAGAAAAKFAQQAVGAAGGFAADHRDQAHDLLSKAQGEVDRVTGGKAQGVVSKVRSGLAAGVDIVADQAPARDAADDPTSGPPSPGV